MFYDTIISVIICVVFYKVKIVFNVLSLQQLKRTGFAKLKQMFEDDSDIIVQERGRDACVLVDINHYNYLRECELEMAVQKARQEIKNGKYSVGVEDHIQKIEKSIKNSSKQK